MAQNYDLKLVVDADTTEAQRKLDALGAPSGGDGAGGGAPSPAAPSPSPAAQEAAARVRRFRLDPSAKPNLSNNPDDFGKRAGDVAGKAIGKAVAGFLANEMSSTIFNGFKTPGGDNRTVNQAEAGVGGALKYGTMGAMLGGPIGAIIGGIGGAVMGVYQERQRQENAVEERDITLRRNQYRRNVDTAMAASDSAFNKALELAGGSRRRVEMIRARRDEIQDGNGDWSIKSLTNQLKGLDPNSLSGQFVAANIEMQRDRVAHLNRQLLEEGLANAPGRMDPGSVADDWAKRGISIGAQVDVSQVNERIMGEVQSCRALLEKIANMNNDGAIGIVTMQRAVFE